MYSLNGLRPFFAAHTGGNLFAQRAAVTPTGADNSQVKRAGDRDAGDPGTRRGGRCASATCVR